MSRWPDSWTCEEIRQHVEIYLEGELPQAATHQVRTHLQDCVECAAQVHLAREIQRELRALPELDAPATTLQKILARKERQQAPPSILNRFWPWRPGPVWVAMAAASLVLVLGWGILQRGAPPSETPDEAVIAQATLEARYALARAGLLTRKAGLALRDKTLRDQVALPARQGLDHVLGGPPARRTEPLTKGVDDV